MNLKERQQISTRYKNLINRWTNALTPQVSEILKKQINGFTSLLKEKGIRAAVAYLDHLVLDADLFEVLADLHRKFTIEYATSTYKRLMVASRQKRYVKKADTGAFGHSDEWNKAVEDYLNQFLLNRAVVPVTDSTKKLILAILHEAQDKGWGIDRIIQELHNTQQNELNDFRARRIVRTELSIAANHGDNMVQDAVPFDVDKIWISTHDNRVRDSHEKMDGVTVAGDASFHVPIIRKRVQIGIDLMNGPGDPEGSPENVINCRCTRAMIPKRDKNGRLIIKQQKLRA